MNQRVQWRRRAQDTRTLLALVLLLAVCGLAACADGSGSVTYGSVPATATATPKGPTIPQTAAVLGGSVFAFDKKLGASNCCYENGYTYQGPYGPLWTGLYTGDIDSMSNVDESSTNRVIGIENGGPVMSDMHWTLTQAKAICANFIPPDAKYQTFTQVNTHSLVQGFEFRYTSASLANALPSNAFKDANGNPTVPGTFYIFYDYGLGPSNTIGWCRLSTDEKWVQGVL
jgi:hypothetical protein